MNILTSLEITISETPGLQLKHKLGLDKLDYVFIQKVLDISIPIYIVTFDTRYNKQYIQRAKIKKSQITSINQILNTTLGLELSSYRLSQAVLIDHYQGYIRNNSIVFTQDLCGYNYQNKNLLESKIRELDNKGLIMERYKRIFKEDLYKTWYNKVKKIDGIELYYTDKYPSSKYEIGLMVDKHKFPHPDEELFSKLFKVRVVTANFIKPDNIWILNIEG